MNETAGHVHAADGTRLVYRVMGQGPPLVLANGVSTSAFFWRKILPHWTPRYRVLFWDYKGHGDSEPAKTKQGATVEAFADDLVRVMDGVGIERAPLIGFSMGGNVVLKYAGERGAACGLERIVAVSPPIEIALASAAIDRGFLNGIYQRAFLESLAAMVRRKARLFPERYDVAGLRGAKTLRIFDDRYIAPCFGFADADDYYFRASAGRHLEGIRAETLVLHAKDDSFVPAAPLEEWEKWAPDHVHIRVTERGGHVGFVAGRSSRGADPDPFWAENRAVDWVTRAGADQLGT